MKKNIKKIVKEKYGKIAHGGTRCCAPKSSCCSGGETEDFRLAVGYSDTDIQSAQGADLSLGCGNPTALASLEPGETVLDLGSGAGFDCFLAAKRVLPGGKVIGLDMTPEMIDKAKENAKKGNYSNVDFLLGEIEDIPLPDQSVDVIISNCVINLSPNKASVFEEAFRVLKPGGRLMVSDIVLSEELPDVIRNNVAAYVGCVAGALLKDQYISLFTETGFEDIEVIHEVPFNLRHRTSDPTSQAVLQDRYIVKDQLESISHTILSISITGRKPL